MRIAPDLGDLQWIGGIGVVTGHDYERRVKIKVVIWVVREKKEREREGNSPDAGF